MTFKADLLFGQQKEAYARGIIEELKHEKTINICNNYKYDFETNKYKYEVKCDRISIHTNLFFIEYEYNGKPSGINRTHADFYLLVVGKNIIEIEVEKLLDLINKKKYVRDVRGGDGGRSKGYLFNLNLIKNSL